jgi:hypothetical protein
MFLRISLTCLLALTCLAFGSRPGWAQMTSQGVPSSDLGEPVTTTAVEKPYEYERQAYGYDPEGFEYKENQVEDFQVVFISSAPFTALASYGLTGLASLAFTGKFGVEGDYFLPFLTAAFIGSTTIACVSVLTNKYPPPPRSFVVYESKPALPPEIVRLTLISTEF